MKKEKCWLWLLFIFMFALSIFSLTACKDENGDNLYLGTYKGGRDTFIVTEEYVNINGENYNYTIIDGRLRVEGSKLDLNFHNNYQVLSFDLVAEFDSGSITERNRYFNATLYNYGNGGILETYIFKSDGTALYINASDTTKNKSGAYRIKDGVIGITFMEIFTFRTSKTYWYVTENGQIYYDVYVKNADTYFNDNNGNNSSDSGNTGNGNSSTGTTTYALNYSVNNSDYGYITGNATQTVDENENGTSVTAVANDGYKFTGWSDGVSTATRQDMNVESNINVTANFIPVSTIDYSKYNYYGYYTMTITNIRGGKTSMTLKLNRNGQYEMTLDAYDENSLKLIEVEETGTYSMDTLQEPIYDETFMAIYLLRFNPQRTIGLIAYEPINVYSGYITGVYWKDYWWMYADHYEQGTTIYLGDDQGSFKMDKLYSL